MSTATKSRQRVKTERRVQLSRPVNGVYALDITIKAGGKVRHFGYYLRPIPADFGMGFQIEKFGAEQEDGEPAAYDVNIDLLKGYHTCTCKGNTYHGHCKHVEALLALILTGKIAAPNAEPQAAVTRTKAPKQPPARQPKHTPIPGKEDAFIYGPFHDEDIYGMTCI